MKYYFCFYTDENTSHLSEYISETTKLHRAVKEFQEKFPKAILKYIKPYNL